MTPHLKVDGITRLHDARFCAAVGVDYLGFEQDPASPRHVPPGPARQIIDWVVGPEPVGLFPGGPAGDVVEACRAGGFRLAQLAEASTQDCAEIEAGGVDVIRSFEVRHDASSEQLLALLEPFAGAARFVRLDTRGTDLWGGPGESLNWRVLREVGQEFDLILAGDVTVDNLSEALRMSPFAIDVMSSVEDAPGVLDFDLLGTLVEALRCAGEAGGM